MFTYLPYRVFGWRAERAGSERTRPCGCLDGRREGWVGSRREYSNPAGFRPSRAPPFVVSVSLSFSTRSRSSLVAGTGGAAPARGGGSHGWDGRSSPTGGSRGRRSPASARHGAAVEEGGPRAPRPPDRPHPPAGVQRLRGVLCREACRLGGHESAQRARRGRQRLRSRRASARGGQRRRPARRRRHGRGERPDRWGLLVASGTLINGVIMPSNPYSQFLQPNMKWVHSVPKIRSATKQLMGRLRPQNPGWIQPNTLIPQPNTRLLSCLLYSLNFDFLFFLCFRSSIVSSFS